MDPKLVRFSKFMSLLLRHRPDQYGLHLDVQGWAGESANQRISERRWSD